MDPDLGYVPLMRRFDINGYTLQGNCLASPVLSTMADIRRSSRLIGVIKPSYTDITIHASTDGFFSVKRQHKKARNRSTNPTPSLELRKTLTAHNLAIKRSIGDGNCLFHSLADQINYHFGAIWGPQNMDHIKLRADTCAHIEKHMDFFGGFLEETLDEKKQDGTWGGNVDIAAIADMYNVAVEIISADQEPNIILPTHCDASIIDGTMSLAFTQEMHYDSTRPLNIDVLLKENQFLYDQMSKARERMITLKTKVDNLKSENDNLIAENRDLREHNNLIFADEY